MFIDFNQDNTNSIVAFKDKDFENLIREMLNKPSGKIYKSDLLKIESLDLSEVGKLVNLKTLYITVSKTEDITPLKDLSNLELLWLRYNNISNVTPLKGLINLEIKLYGNEIESAKIDSYKD